MREGRGSFLTQALLAIALIAAVMPLIARRIASRQNDVIVTATVVQISDITNAAASYVSANATNVPFGATVVSGIDLSDILAEYGDGAIVSLHTPLRQDISLVLLRDNDEKLFLIQLSDGDLSGVRKMDLMRRIGFFAASAENNVLNSPAGGWREDANRFGYNLSPKSIYIKLPGGPEFSEYLRKFAAPGTDNKFYTDLDMGGFDIKNSKDVSTDAFDSKSLTAIAVNISGAMNYKNAEYADAVFRNNLSMSGNMTSQKAHVGRIDASGNIDAGNARMELLQTDSISASFLKAGNGDFARSVSAKNLEASSIATSGVSVDRIEASHITIRDARFDNLSRGSAGAMIFDLRLSGASIMPDLILESLDADAIRILRDPSADNDMTRKCGDLIAEFMPRAKYDKRSLSQNIACQYVFWRNLERRIDIKKCLQDGDSNCEKKY
jgi:hypothetical protein